MSGGAGRRVRDGASLFALAMSLAVLAWAVGFVVALRVRQPSPPVPEGIEAPPNWQLFGEAWTYVEREFYWPPPAASSVTRGAIEGMLAALDDPYAAYLEAGRGTGQRTLAPEFVPRLGAWIEVVDKGPLVVATLPDSPGRTAGLVPGEVVVAIDDQILVGSRTAEVLDAFDGAVGSELSLVVFDAQGAGRAVDLGGRKVDRPRVEIRRLAEHVLYAALPCVCADAAGQLATALGELGQPSAEAIVLDLRDNPGGDVDSLGHIASRLFEGPLWVFVDREGGQTVHDVPPSNAGGDLRASRYWVLVNDGTAGAAEILAGALRDNLGAVLVGTSTFGKGSFQVLRPLADDSALRLTAGHWRTPAGIDFDGVGLSPDRALSDPEAQLEAARNAALGVTGG